MNSKSLQGYSLRWAIIFIVIHALTIWNVATAEGRSCPKPIAKNTLAYRGSRIFLATDRTSYKINQSIALYAGVRNMNEDKSIYIYRNLAWGYGGGLVLHLRDSAGREVRPTVMDDTMLPPPKSLDDKGIFVELKAEEIFGLGRILSLRDMIKSPGQYYLQVEYKSPLSCSIVDSKLQHLPALWHEDVSLMSNTLYIEITQ